MHNRTDANDRGVRPLRTNSFAYVTKRFREIVHFVTPKPMAHRIVNDKIGPNPSRTIATLISYTINVT